MSDLRKIIDAFEKQGHDARLEGVGESSAEVALLFAITSAGVREYRVTPRGNLPREHNTKSDALYTFSSLSAAQRVRAEEMGLNYVVPSTGELVLHDVDTSVEKYSGEQCKRRTHGGVLPGILRAVIREREWLTQKELAAELGVSQQAISKGVRQLESDYGIVREHYDPSALLAAYRIVDDLDVAVTWSLSALDDPLSLRPAITDYLNSLVVNWAFTGVLAADHYAPYVVPTAVTILCDEDVNLEDIGLFRSKEASAGEFLVAAPGRALNQVVHDDSGARYTDPLTTWGFLNARNRLDDGQAADALKEWILRD